MSLVAQEIRRCLSEAKAMGRAGAELQGDALDAAVEVADGRDDGFWEEENPFVRAYLRGCRERERGMPMHMKTVKVARLPNGRRIALMEQWEDPGYKPEHTRERWAENYQPKTTAASSAKTARETAEIISKVLPPRANAGALAINPSNDFST